MDINRLINMQCFILTHVYKAHTTLLTHEELDGPAVSALRRAIAEVKQSWSVIEWVTENL
jgi:hypothetical protein